MRNNQSDNHHKNDKQVFPFYPLLFGIYPVLSLAGYNISQIDISQTYRAMALSLILAGVMFFTLRLLLRNWLRAAVLTLFLLVLFFSYGQIYSLLKYLANPLSGLARHRILGPIWFVLGGVSIWVATRKSIDPAPMTLPLNVIALLLLVYPLFQIGQYEVTSFRHRAAVQPSNPSTTTINAAQAYPDIYYIILDAYMRADNLKVVYGFDNSAFIQALTQRGFYVANCSQSNYGYTELSLASSLNTNYFDQLVPGNNTAADSLIQDNYARSFLKEHGYTIVAFETGYRFSQWEDADIYYKYTGHTNYASQPDQINGFETLFLETTLLRIPWEALKLDVSTSEYTILYNREISILNILKTVPVKVQGPKFVFVHLVVTHPPYIFNPTGTFAPTPQEFQFFYDLTSPGPDKPGYPNAVTFTNSAILKEIDTILADSKIPPVIILQGDHGAFRFSEPEQRMSILNAYFFPNSTARAALYPTITPVNTFRILFNSYFGQSLPLLPDISHYSLGPSWSLTTVPNPCR